MNRLAGLLIIAGISTMQAVAAAQTAVDTQSFSVERGKSLWNQNRTVSGQQRSCAVCHTSSPDRPGKHVRTGKSIKPMAPSANPERFSDERKIAKWFKRNCKWTLGRECSLQEKGDITLYLKSI